VDRKVAKQLGLKDGEIVKVRVWKVKLLVVGEEEEEKEEKEKEDTPQTNPYK